jgi:hypothetical protein
MWSTDSGSATSASRAPATPPSCSMSETTDWAAAICTSATATFAPLRASVSAQAAPMPDPPPLTSATLSATS